VNLSDEQRLILATSYRSRTFLSGPAGCGKTTVGVEHLRGLIQSGIPADSILLLTPQRTLQEPYLQALRDPSLARSSEPNLVTVSGLAHRMLELFWPMVAESAGFSHPLEPPVFLNLETAQYYMALVVRPLLDQGFFASVSLDRNRLYTQVLENLAKAASVGFEPAGIAERLSTAWMGDPAQRRVYADAQECALRFRQLCLDHNLVDFSLQLEIFWKILWRLPECSQYLISRSRHLVYDNSEEDIPIAHDLLGEWLPAFDSALVIHDNDGGFRTNLGADPHSALRLADFCQEQALLDRSFVSSPQVQALEQVFISHLLPGSSTSTGPRDLQALAFPPPDIPIRFFPQMIDWVAGEINRLVTEEQVPPTEIVVLAPYLSDALRFSLSHRLDELGLPWRSHRPSRSLREEPASHCLVTLAELAHPLWKLHPTKFDVAYALVYAFEDLDLVRAQLLAEIVYRQKDFSLSSFEAIRPEVQERITFVFGERYEKLRHWLEAYRQQPNPDPLDHFLRRLFGEALSQKGFGFHRNNDAARTAASLIDSILNFRHTMEPLQGEIDIGKEYIATLQDGVLAAQYIEAWKVEPGQGILISPAYTFLMMNRPVSFQFWLDAGSYGWWERLQQPLTHPYVLSREWDGDRQWTDADELAANQNALANLVSGLLRRCKERVYIGVSELGESGFEQRGPFLKTIWKMQMEAQAAGEQ
jgi:hypothetical protein